jgi:hypothetical protein
LIDGYKININEYSEVTNADRRVIRKKGLNCFTKLSDGGVYMPLSGGVTSGGINIPSLRLADYWTHKIRQFQSDFETQIDVIRLLLVERGYDGSREVEASLTYFDEYSARVHFPKYLIDANVSIASPAQSQ